MLAAGMAPQGLGEAAKCVFCIAGTSSGVGKSSMVVGIAGALRERGLTVQAFKVGPDFIDPMHHQVATGRPSINLDSWMLSREQVLAAFHRAAAGADAAIVEGVMGLFDGRDGTTEQGSTAQLAKWLGVPVVLVLDASAIARSAAAVAKGYTEFDPDLRLGGLLFNKVGSPAHTQWLQDAMEASGIQAAVMGGVPKNAEVVVPERHLGLHMPGDDSVPANLVSLLAGLVEANVDLDALLELGATAEVPPPPPATPTAPAEQGAAAGVADDGEQQQLQQQQREEQLQPVRIAVARDAAFCFCYNDNLHLLRQAGAELVFFSPMVDSLPADCAGVYLGGGYPERYAVELTENRLMRSSLAAFAKAGGVVYAECGGLLYLSKSIQPSSEEAPRRMVGVFPFKTVMCEDKMKMGYVEVETEAGCPLFPPGRKVRGQVYHYSEIVQESVVGGLGQALAGKAGAAEPQAWATCYRVQPQIPGAEEVAEGFYQQNVLATYVHLHFGNCPDFASSLVDKCRKVDLEALSAAVSEAAQTEAYLESAVASLHSTPRSAIKGSRAVHHCRSSPDFARDERMSAAKQQRMSSVEPLREQPEDGRQLHALPGSENEMHHRHGSLQHHAGIPPRSLSPATTLSKVFSMNSLSSYSPHIGTGVLPPGEVLSPPLSDSPQQLSPRELEQAGGQQHAYFGGQSGHQNPHQQQQQQQQHLYLQHGQQQQQYGQQNGQHGQQQQNGYGHHASPQHHQQQHNQQQQQQQHLPPYVPPLQLDGMAGYGGQRQHSQHAQHAQGGQGQLPYNYSWPRLHQPGVQPPILNGRPGVSAFAAASVLQQQQQGHQQGLYGPSGGPALGTAGSIALNAANSIALGTSGSLALNAANSIALGTANSIAGNGWLPPPSNGRHSRSASYDLPRPASGGGAAAMLAGNPSTPIELQSLEPRHLALSATPYNWQHSHTPSDKIVSLSPGATEMLWALGLGARVAAVSDACDFPPDAVARAKARRSFAATSSYASSLDRQGGGGGSAGTSGPASRRESPTCLQQQQQQQHQQQNGGNGGGNGGSAAWQPARTSGGGSSPRAHKQPQQQNHHQHHQGVEFVVDEEVLARERPGLVVYEEAESTACGTGSAAGGSAMMCGGCGMGQAVVQALVAVGLQQSCRVVCVRRRTLSDVLESMLVVGEAAGVREEALRAVDRLRSRLRSVAGEAAVAAAAAPSRPHVLVLQSLRPLRTVGWWLPDQVLLAGGACWPEEQAGDASMDLTWEQVQAFAPDVLVIAGMAGGSALAPLTDLCHIASLPGWWLLPAVRSSSVFVADAALLCRPGPRLVEGVECLARMLWDDAVPECACPDRAVLKLSLRPGQRCRPRLLPNHFVPFTQ